MRFVRLIWMGCLVAGCQTMGSAHAASGCDDLSGGPINFNVDWQTEIVPLFNTAPANGAAQCVQCHTSGAMPNLVDDGATPNLLSRLLLAGYVEPGDPKASRIFLKVNCEDPGSGGRMPLIGPAMSREAQALLFDWIDQGARGPVNIPLTVTFVFGDGLESTR